MSYDFFKLAMSNLHHEGEKRESYVRAPFGWPGGKSKSIDQILPRIPMRDSWIETCGGSGILTLNRERSNLDVFNDRDAGVVAFYRCLRDFPKLQDLKARLELCVHSREEFVWCKDTWKDCTDDVERAARWYYIVRCSFSQLKRNFARATTGKYRNNLPAQIRNAIPDFSDVHSRLKEVQIENMDLFQILEDYDDEGAVFYIDPNYLGSSKGVYEHEIDEAAHYRLCNRIMNGKGFFALSGYPNSVYDSFKWDHRYTWEVPVTVKAQAFTAENNKEHLRDVNGERTTATEVLWIRDHNATTRP